MKLFARIAAVLGAFSMLFGCDGADTTASRPDIVIMGDSIFDLSDEIKAELERLSGETFRQYAVSGAEMENGVMGNIPDQYPQAKADGTVKIVIMDGGGNDIQVGASASCTSGIGQPTTACKNALKPALTAMETLWDKMKADGVKKVIYMNYFYIVASGSKPAFNWMHDQMAALAAKSKYANFIIVTDPMPFMKDSLIGSDNIHPTDEGSQKLAQQIWNEALKNLM